MCQNMQLSMQEKKANMDADVGVLRAELAKEKQLRVRATCSVAPQHTQGQCVLMYAHTRRYVVACKHATQKTARSDGAMSKEEHQRFHGLERRLVLAEEKLQRTQRQFDDAEAGRRLALQEANTLREVCREHCDSCHTKPSCLLLDVCVDVVTVCVCVCVCDCMCVCVCVCV